MINLIDVNEILIDFFLGRIQIDSKFLQLLKIFDDIRRERLYLISGFNGFLEVSRKWFNEWILILILASTTRTITILYLRTSIIVNSKTKKKIQ